MPRTEKKYPEWVQKHRRVGTTVKERNGKYYLYKRTSRRVPGKKYPQAVDTYIGVITPDGVIESNRRKVTITDIEVYEYGFSKAVIQLCPEGWKRAIGEDWEDYLKIIITEHSNRSYLFREGTIKKKEDYHHSYGVQVAALVRRMRLEQGTDLNELAQLKDIYLVYLEKEPVVSRICESHREILEKYGIRLGER
ncbi:MAG: hypothetical protein IIZ78_06940 [Clostridiales bacterium]|nr:hypothetical protein [Clostridiales bacterium]